VSAELFQKVVFEAALVVRALCRAAEVADPLVVEPDSGKTFI
jgi:hypothetical protein